MYRHNYSTHKWIGASFILYCYFVHFEQCLFGKECQMGIQYTYSNTNKLLLFISTIINWAFYDTKSSKVLKKSEANRPGSFKTRLLSLSLNKIYQTTILLNTETSWSFHFISQKQIHIFWTGEHHFYFTNVRKPFWQSSFKFLSSCLSSSRF